MWIRCYDAYDVTMPLTAQFFCCVLVEDGKKMASLHLKMVMFKGSSFKISTVGIEVGGLLLYFSFHVFLSNESKSWEQLAGGILSGSQSE